MCGTPSTEAGNAFVLNVLVVDGPLNENREDCHVIIILVIVINKFKNIISNVITTCKSMMAVVYLTPSHLSSLLITLINFGSTVRSIIVLFKPT